MSEVFAAYSKYYDLLYRDKDYAAEAQYVAARIKRLNAGASRVLELGCGTGAHAALLAKMGFHVHGIDLSAGMVDKANERKAALPPDVAARLSFAQGDIRHARADGKFDAVISLFHVMSYQTRNEDLVAACETAAAHLNAGGAFIFDFWHGAAVLAQLPEVRVKRLEDDEVEIVRIAEPVVDFSANRVDVHFDVFVIDKQSRRAEEIREKHSMRYLFAPELHFLAGRRFDVESVCAWMGDQAPGSADWSAVACFVRCAS